MPKYKDIKLDIKSSIYYSFFGSSQYTSNEEEINYDRGNKPNNDFGLIIGANLTYDITQKHKLDFEYNYLFRFNGEKNNAPPFNFWQNGHSFKIGFLYGLR